MTTCGGTAGAEPVLAPGTATHGVALVIPGAGGGEATEAMAAFLAKHAPAR